MPEYGIVLTYDGPLIPPGEASWQWSCEDPKEFADASVKALKPYLRGVGIRRIECSPNNELFITLPPRSWLSRSDKKINDWSDEIQTLGKEVVNSTNNVLRISQSNDYGRHYMCIRMVELE